MTTLTFGAENYGQVFTITLTAGEKITAIQCTNKNSTLATVLPDLAYPLTASLNNARDEYAAYGENTYKVSLLNGAGAAYSITASTTYTMSYAASLELWNKSIGRVSPKAAAPVSMLTLRRTAAPLNIIHEIPGRAGPIVSYVDGGIQRGSIELLFDTEADALEGYEVMRAASTFYVARPDAGRDVYGVAENIQLQHQTAAGDATRWGIVATYADVMP